MTETPVKRPPSDGGTTASTPGPAAVAPAAHQPLGDGQAAGSSDPTAAPDPAEKDLHPTGFPRLSWGDGELTGSLETLYDWVANEMARADNWYLIEKHSEAHWPRTLRVAAVLLATLGTGLLLVAATTASTGAACGSVALVAAAGALALDKGVRFPASWMRYMTTELAIKQYLDELHTQWTSQSPQRGERPPWWPPQMSRPKWAVNWRGRPRRPARYQMIKRGTFDREHVALYRGALRERLVVITEPRGDVNGVSLLGLAFVFAVTTFWRGRDGATAFDEEVDRLARLARLRTAPLTEIGRIAPTHPRSSTPTSL
jgi:hypothetical protein